MKQKIAYLIIVSYMATDRLEEKLEIKDIQRFKKFKHIYVSE